jgi:hypothetical protein
VVGDRVYADPRRGGQPADHHGHRRLRTALRRRPLAGRRAGQTRFDVTAPANAAADAGFLVISNGTSPAIDCANYMELTATATTIVGPDRTKTVTATIDHHLISAQHRTTSSVQMCFGAPYPFAPRPGVVIVTKAPGGSQDPAYRP